MPSLEMKQSLPESVLVRRITNVSDDTYQAGYSRLANSPLISQVSYGSNTTARMTTTTQYDFLNRLLSISSVGSTGASPVAVDASSTVSFTYAYNDANQRTRVNLADGSFWIYDYDALGQVKSGKRYWSDWTPVAGQQFEYGFDELASQSPAIWFPQCGRSAHAECSGNRNSTKSGGDSAGANLRVASYTNNSLNQITSRDVPAYLNVIGAATATATNVNVNDVLAYRKGEYYRVELNPDNSANPVWQSVTNRAVQSGTTNSVTGNAFLPKNPEVFGYDADGNLTNDGRWAYVWDGENRLVRMFAPTTAPSGSVKALTFGYDWQGRRISKTVSNYSGGAWSRVLEEKYLYDGWNLLSSLNATDSAVVQAFLWGSDLSGSMQGAGGVGGLLAVKANGVSVTFAAFDGNGNVTALVNAADGNTLATYEYGPFGEVIRASGTAAKTNPFRFSTKFQDDESDYLYYGYRFYSQSIGRWFNRDPIEERGGRNLYSFVVNSALNRFDPVGLFGCSRDSCGDPCGDVKDKRGNGGVVCCRGKKYSCVWRAGSTSDSTAMSIAKKCIEAHEDTHHGDIDCPLPGSADFDKPTRPGFRDQDPNHTKAEECAGYQAQLKCLKERRKECGGDPACLIDLRTECERIRGSVFEKCGTMPPPDTCK